MHTVVVCDLVTVDKGPSLVSWMLRLMEKTSEDMKPWREHTLVQVFVDLPFVLQHER